MNNTGNIDVMRVAQVFRAARKLAGKTQQSVASAIGVTQSTYSKFESGRLLPSYIQWYDLCRELKIQARGTYEDGIIDHCSSISSQETYPEARFKIAKRYKHHTGSKVRMARIFLNYFTSVYGEKKTKEYLKRVGVDPDLFVVLDHQINIQFSLDLLEMMIRDAQLKKENIPSLTSIITSTDIQGRLANKYVSCDERSTIFEALIANMNKYEVNFEYAIEEKSRNYLVISDKPRSILRHFNYKNDTLGSFLCDYKSQWFKQFSLIHGGKASEVQVLEDHYKGAPQCVYKILL